MSGKVINGRPLWEQLDGDNFFFYTSTRHWLVGPDFNSSAGCIHSKDMFLETIPVRGWQYDPERGRDSSATTFSFWTKDPLIRVEGEDKMRNRFENLLRGVDRTGHPASAGHTRLGWRDHQCQRVIDRPDLGSQLLELVKVNILN